MPSAERPAQCSTEQLHLPQSVTGLLSLPEVAALPISPAESSVDELEHVFKYSLKFKGPLVCLREQPHYRNLKWQN